MTLFTNILLATIVKMTDLQLGTEISDAYRLHQHLVQYPCCHCQEQKVSGWCLDLEQERVPSFQMLFSEGLWKNWNKSLTRLHPQLVLLILSDWKPKKWTCEGTNAYRTNRHLRDCTGWSFTGRNPPQTGTISWSERSLSFYCFHCPIPVYLNPIQIRYWA